MGTRYARSMRYARGIKILVKHTLSTIEVNVCLIVTDRQTERGETETKK